MRISDWSSDVCSSDLWPCCATGCGWRRSWTSKGFRWIRCWANCSIKCRRRGCEVHPHGERTYVGAKLARDTGDSDTGRPHRFHSEQALIQHKSPRQKILLRMSPKGDASMIPPHTHLTA